MNTNRQFCLPALKGVVPPFYDLKFKYLACFDETVYLS